MSIASLLAKAITDGLDESERRLLPPPLLAQLAAAGHLKLTLTDRRRLPRSTLALLSVGGFITLTRYERDSLPSHTLALLANNGRAEFRAMFNEKTIGGRRDRRSSS
jgi:hypothetical protein